jgi:oxygen-independent coproporphyrinogen III oxidase
MPHLTDPSPAAPSPAPVRHGYVHIPFCHRVCPYCSFYKHTPGNTDIAAFVEAVLREAELRSQLHPCQFETLYFGGGTPTALSLTHLDHLLTRLRQVFDLSQLREFTFEANPRTVPPAKADLLRQHGVTRVSLGVQAWDEATLTTLGRDHSPQEAEATYRTLRATGFDSVNLDLMFSIPGQSLETWKTTLQRSIDLAPDHLSAYNLNYEEDTEFFDRLARGQYREVPDQDADFFHTALDLLEAAGYAHYEISNYARPGHESQHNAAYWFGKDYLALGPGCTSTIAGQRWQNLMDTTGYIQQIQNNHLPATDLETLTPEQRRTERFGLELRTRQGLPLDLIQPDRLPLLQQLATDHLLTVQDQHIRLTRLGKPLVDSIAVALLG